MTTQEAFRVAYDLLDKEIRPKLKNFWLFNVHICDGIIDHSRQILITDEGEIIHKPTFPDPSDSHLLCVNDGYISNGVIGKIPLVNGYCKQQIIRDFLVTMTISRVLTD